MKPGATGLTRLIHATAYSMAGLRAAWINEAAFRQELMLTVLLSPVGLWLGNGAVERALLIGSLLLVVAVELMNSAVEAVVDRIGPEHHPLAGRAKDMGSAAVLFSLLNVALVWGLILWDRFT
ncbi:MAG: diacylglycerol kinase [Magnetococcales bacterium]|nr:diacylglycerol kinase [Magnetococcales bacterium]MBF0438994.1 diacylglycerol kinase [Magnetococcales bacterium]